MGRDRDEAVIDRDKVAMNYLEIDIESAGVLKQLCKLAPSKLLVKLVGFEEAKLDQIIQAAERISSLGYAEQEIFNPWQINRIEEMSRFSRQILLHRVMGNYTPDD
jgi:hypothetical protein